MLTLKKENSFIPSNVNYTDELYSYVQVIPSPPSSTFHDASSIIERHLDEKIEDYMLTKKLVMVKDARLIKELVFILARGKSTHCTLHNYTY